MLSSLAWGALTVLPVLPRSGENSGDCIYKEERRQQPVGMETNPHNHSHAYIHNHTFTCTHTHSPWLGLNGSWTLMQWQRSLRKNHRFIPRRDFYSKRSICVHTTTCPHTHRHTHTYIRLTSMHVCPVRKRLRLPAVLDGFLLFLLLLLQDQPAQVRLDLDTRPPPKSYSLRRAKRACGKHRACARSGS